MAVQSTLIKTIKEKFPAAVVSFHSFRNDDTIVIKKDNLKEIMLFLKNDKEMQFNMLIDVTAVDYLGSEPRFEVVYHLLSLPLKQRLRIKVPLEESEAELESITSIYPGANWFEREVYDMFGIKFKNHPNLKRLLMYDEFEGHPLRKDFPLKKQYPRIPMREVKTKY
jgi:NADH-quinone oxidoreductase subunit C